MQKPMKKKLLSLLSVAVCGMQTAHTAPATGETPADQCVRLSGISRGMAVFPRINDGVVPKALALQGDWMVYVQDAARDKVENLSKWAEENSLLGRRLYVEQRKTQDLPLADGMAELLVVTDLGKEDLTVERLESWMRLLVPGRGVAILGNERGFDLDAVSRWLGKTAGGRLVTDGGKTWAVIKRPALPEGDDWKQKFHDADNNRVSNDRSLKPPFVAQWYGLPLNEAFWGTTVVAANGRFYTLCLFKNAKHPVALVARSLGNGMVLWKRDFPYKTDDPKVGYNPSLVADGDQLLLVEYDHVLRLDGETGRELGVIAGPRDGKQIKWMALSDGFLALLAGADEQFDFTGKQSQPVMKAPSGRWLSVSRMSDGARQWAQEAPGEIDERMIAIRKGRIFYHVSQVGTFCRKLAGGEQVWANTSAETIVAIETGRDKIKDVDLSVKGMQIAHASLIAQDEALVIGALWYDNIVALDAGTGALLWQTPHNRFVAGRCVPQLAIQGKWYSANGVYDLRTGKQLDKLKLQAFGCGPTTALPGYFIGCFGDVSEASTGKLLRPMDDKGPCDVGSIVAGGLVLCPASTCNCGVPVKGSRAFTSAPDLALQTSLQNANRLQKGAEPPVIVSFAVDNKDWPALRHDNGRSGATAVPVTVSGTHRLLWRWKAPTVAATAAAGSLLGTWVPTMPVAAAGRAWFGGVDGVIRQFDAATGELQWEYPTGAKLFAPPVAANGRVYAGTGTGEVLCLESASGKLLWRFRAAPVDRRMLWYGQLIGTWPLVGGVTVQDGKVYAIAGYQNLNGTHAYALDAVNGSVIWETHDAGTGPGTWGGEGSYGATVIAGDRLWWCGGGAQPASFRLQDGVRSFLPNEAFSCSRFGSQLMVLNKDWLLYGGKRLSTMQGPGTVFNEDGLAVSPGFPLSKPADSQQKLCVGVTLPGYNPAADDSLLVMTDQQDGKLVGCDPKKLGADIAACYHDGPEPARPAKYYAKALASPVTSASDKASTVAAGSQSALLWGPTKFGSKGFVLAGDAVVALNGPWSKPQIIVLDRKTGAELWRVDLPSDAAPGGLCVDREGHILVALMDGSLVCCGP